MDFNSLKKYVGDRINEVCTISVYSKKAHEKKSYPFVTYSFPSSDNPVRKRENWIVEVDFWDNTNSTIIIGAQAELLRAGFDYYWQSEDEGFYTSHKIFQGEVPVLEPNFSRIQQRYLLKVR